MWSASTSKAKHLGFPILDEVNETQLLKLMRGQSLTDNDEDSNTPLCARILSRRSGFKSKKCRKS